MALLCPKCVRDTLAELTIDGIEVNRCTGCGGMWFDKGELGSLLNSDTGRVGPLLGADPNDTDARRGCCPRDNRKLVRVLSARNQQVWIENCRTCQGIWLDGGEFARIKTAQPGLRLGDLV